MAKGRNSFDEQPRVGKVRRAGEFVSHIGGNAFRRFGFVQSAVVERWPEIVGEHYAAISLPESIRFPAKSKRGGTLTLLVEGAQAPLFQHLTPMIIERVNDFFGSGAINKVVFRQGRVPRRDKGPVRPTPAPVPDELGEGLRAIADPELRACLESLASSLEGSKGPPQIKVVGRIGDPISSKRSND